MRFVAVEGVDSQIVDTLRTNGHDVFYIAETSPGSLDDEILDLASLEDRILVTRDKDFSELVFRDKMIHSGIILNRLHQLSSENKARIVLKVIEKYQDELIGAFTVIQPHKIRIRKRY